MCIPTGRERERVGGTQTGSYQTGSYQKGRFIPPKPKSLYVFVLWYDPVYMPLRERGREGADKDNRDSLNRLGCINDVLLPWC